MSLSPFSQENFKILSCAGLPLSKNLMPLWQLWTYKYSAYCWLFAFGDTLAENAVRAIIDWFAALGVPRDQMSYGPTQFRSEILRLVSKGLKVPHHFMLSYNT